MQVIVQEYGRTFMVAIVFAMAFAILLVVARTELSKEFVNTEAVAMASDQAAEAVMSRVPPVIYCETALAGQTYEVSNLIHASDEDGNACNIQVMRVEDSSGVDITDSVLVSDKGAYMSFGDFGLYRAHVTAVDDQGAENNCWVNISVNGEIK